MFVEVRNRSYAATRNPAGNRQSKEPGRKLCGYGGGRNTELSKGCEVKRETLNLVVSPVRKGFGRAEALVMAAGNRDQDAKDEYWSNRSGVADSIEQHIMN